MQQLLSTNNKRMGYIDTQEKVLHKRFKASKHLFKKLNALGLDYEAWKTVLLPQDYEIRALDEESDTVYYAQAHEFKEKGTVMQFKGHALQTFLPLKYWKSKKLKK